MDVLSPDSRKKAMRRLQQEVWDKNKGDIDRAARAETPPPIERVFVAVADAFFLELATTGDAKLTGPAMRDLGARAFRLTGTEVTRYARAIDQMSQVANSAAGYGDWAVT